MGVKAKRKHWWVIVHKETMNTVVAVPEFTKRAAKLQLDTHYNRKYFKVIKVVESK